MFPLIFIIEKKVVRYKLGALSICVVLKRFDIVNSIVVVEPMKVENIHQNKNR